MSDVPKTTRVRRLPPLPPRPENSHKGTFGRVMIAGGCRQYVGAPALAGWAALVSGCGLATVAIETSLASHVVAICPELTAIPVGASLREMIEYAQACNVLVVGPGMGISSRSRRIVTRLLPIDRPKVIDADALNQLAGSPGWLRDSRGELVLTPHPGEMARLMKLNAPNPPPMGDRSRTTIAVEASRRFGATVVLKGACTVVTDGKRVYVNTTGNSSLAKAGTGDVLSGVIASLIAQGMSAFDAAVAGTFIHGRAGELAGAKLGRRSVLARDVIAALPASFRRYASAKS